MSQNGKIKRILYDNKTINSFFSEILPVDLLSIVGDKIILNVERKHSSKDITSS